MHEVDARTAVRLPLQGRLYAMVLALVELDDDGQRPVQAFVNYPEPETFVAPSFEGSAGYEILGAEVVLHADGILNPRAGTNVSGTLSVELWAYPASDWSAAGSGGGCAGRRPVSGAGGRAARRFQGAERLRLVPTIVPTLTAPAVEATKPAEVAKVVEAAKVAPAAKPAKAPKQTKHVCRS